MLVLVSLCWLAPSASAQTRGTFTGLVSDPTGAVIPGATVTATNEGTGVATARSTNGEGLYTIPDLQPGYYTLRAAAQGFKALVNAHIELTVGYTQKVNFKLEVGSVTQSVTVESQAPAVDTETDRMSELVTARQVENLPLNGRNIFQMIQLAPGAVNTTNLISEPGNRGFTTVVNGARVNMNGYLLDGISDKGLSGGTNTQPSQDTVQEFRVDTENLSAEYGSTVGALTTVVTKSGTNQFHGDVYEYARNDKLDARNFFEGDQRAPFRMNEFGGTLGGPIKKNKLFFFGSFEGERTRAPVSVFTAAETPQFRSLIEQYAPNSVAALLYKNFPAPTPTIGVSGVCTTRSDGICTLGEYITQISDGGCGSFDGNCLSGTYGIAPASALGTALLASQNMPTFGNMDATAAEYTSNQFYDGNQFSGKIDYQGDKDKVFGRYFYDRFADPHYSPSANGGAPAAFVAARGFASPSVNNFPQFALGWAHTFSPNVLNDFHAGWSHNATDIGSNNAGVPEIALDSGEVDFGNYSGYPQIFHEEVFHFSDMVTISHGKHTLKIGGDIMRNYENGEFNVGRPSYDFSDGLALAMAEPYAENAGVAPGTINPATGQSTGSAALASNIRAWRNISTGAFFNDDWKVTPRFTLQLGLRYDLFTRHTEKYGQVTTFLLPSVGNLTDNLRALNCYVDVSGGVGENGKPCNGGFAVAPGALTTGDHNDFGPRVGFAWDVRGNGKTSLRGGFGVSYNGEVYNPLSNSRWDPPFYSFNLAGCSSGINVTGAANPDACIFGPTNGAAPSYTGTPTDPGHGPAGATDNAFAGNISGWNPYNSNAAYLTGVVFPGFRDPYVYGSHLSLEHEFAGGFVLKTSWVGTFGHKLYRAEDINRYFGGRNANNATGVGQSFCTYSYRINCLFGRIRVWENSVNSNYDALQMVLEKRMSHGVELHANYEWSHSLDERSTWHSGATTSNGAAEGFSMDQARPGLDYGNSIFDHTQSLTLSYVWQLPWLESQQGFKGHVLGGWQVNGIISFHTGFPWTPYCSASSSGSKACDFNRDGIANDRPNQPAFGNTDPFGNGNAVFESSHPSVNFNPASFYCADSTKPPAGCSTYSGTPFDGNLGRNTFRGPDATNIDFSLFKNIKVTERVRLQFRAEAFNIFNHTNLQMPSPTFGASTSIFGLATGAYAARQIQFALKMMF
jgi:hypothetical protein